MSQMQERQPFIKNNVENATPSSKMEVVRYKMRPLHQKLHRWVLAKCTCPPAALLSNKPYSRCSISTMDWAGAWLGAKLVGRLAGWMAGGIPRRVKKCNPFARNSAQNATPSSEMHVIRRVCLPYINHLGAFRCAENRTPLRVIASKMRPLKQNFNIKCAKSTPLHQKLRRKCDPSCRNEGHRHNANRPASIV